MKELKGILSLTLPKLVLWTDMLNNSHCCVQVPFAHRKRMLALRPCPGALFCLVFSSGTTTRGGLYLVEDCLALVSVGLSKVDGNLVQQAGIWSLCVCPWNGLGVLKLHLLDFHCHQMGNFLYAEPSLFHETMIKPLVCASCNVYFPSPLLTGRKTYN